MNKYESVLNSKKTTIFAVMENLGKFNWLIIVAVLVGGLMPIQSSINAWLGQYLKSPFQATLVNFMGGVVVLAVLLIIFLRPEYPTLAELRQIPWYLFVGGAFGVVFVTAIVLLTPRIGITNMMAGILTGQLIIAVLLDHFGWLNNHHPITPTRIAGIILLILGIILTQK
ncbi:MAG TPA: DMT family transporter [Bacteroidales bacterium]|nr:DMT family transporter [Bacteroidales bacterium]